MVVPRLGPGSWGEALEGLFAAAVVVGAALGAEEGAFQFGEVVLAVDAAAGVDLEDGGLQMLLAFVPGDREHERGREHRDGHPA